MTSCSSLIQTFFQSKLLQILVVSVVLSTISNSTPKPALYCSSTLHFLHCLSTQRELIVCIITLDRKSLSLPPSLPPSLSLHSIFLSSASPPHHHCSISVPLPLTFLRHHAIIRSQVGFTPGHSLPFVFQLFFPSHFIC